MRATAITGPRASAIMSMCEIDETMEACRREVREGVKGAYGRTILILWRKLAEVTCPVEREDVLMHAAVIIAIHKSRQRKISKNQLAPEGERHQESLPSFSRPDPQKPFRLRFNCAVP